MKQRVFTGLVSLLVLLKVVCQVLAKKQDDDWRFELRGPKFPLEYLPIIDEVQIERAFTKRIYLTFLLKCVFFEGPCDLVGKWLKPRTLAALYGTCLVCTPFQQQNMEKWLLSLIYHNEDLFRMAMVKVCVDMDIQVPEDEKLKMKPMLTAEDIKRIYEPKRNRTSRAQRRYIIKDLLR